MQKRRVIIVAQWTLGSCSHGLMCWRTLKELMRAGTSAPRSKVLGKEWLRSWELYSCILMYPGSLALLHAGSWLRHLCVKLCHLSNATCFVLLCCSFPCDEVATWRIIPWWEGYCLPACIHSTKSSMGNIREGQSCWFYQFERLLY